MRGRLRAIRARGGKVVVVDPRRTRTAEEADEHHFIRPGHRRAAADGASSHVLFDEGLVDPGALGRARRRPRRRRASSRAGFTPERVAAATRHRRPTTIRALARELAAAPTRRGLRPHRHDARRSSARSASWLVDVLNVLTGNLDRPGGAMFPKRRRRRAEHQRRARARARRAAPGAGAVARARPARGARRAARRRAWPRRSRRRATGQIRALVTIAGNPVLSHAERRRASRAALDDARLHGLRRHLPQRDDAPRRRDPARRRRRSSARTTTSRFYAVRRAQRRELLAAGVRRAEPGCPTSGRRCCASPAIVAGPGPGRRRRRDRRLRRRARLAARVARRSSPPATARRGCAAAPPRPRAPARPRCCAPGPTTLDARRPRGRRRTASTSARWSRGCPRCCARRAGKIELAPAADRRRRRRACAAALDARRNGGMVLDRPPRPALEQLVDAQPAAAGAAARRAARVHVHPDDAARLGLADGERRARVARAPARSRCPVEVTDERHARRRLHPARLGPRRRRGARWASPARTPGVNSNVLTDEQLLDVSSRLVALNGDAGQRSSRRACASRWPPVRAAAPA